MNHFHRKLKTLQRKKHLSEADKIFLKIHTAYTNLPELKEYTKKLVKYPTSHEVQFYQRLKNEKIPFVFQQLVAPYILDFYFPTRMLCVELDGRQHYAPEKTRYDVRRTEYLNKLGITVIRIPNSEVLTFDLQQIKDLPKKGGALSQIVITRVNRTWKGLLTPEVKEKPSNIKSKNYLSYEDEIQQRTFRMKNRNKILERLVKEQKADMYNSHLRFVRE